MQADEPAMTELVGTCGACGAAGRLHLVTSPLQAPATVAICSDCYDQGTLPLSFVRARVEYADELDLRDFHLSAEQFGFTVLLDGQRVPLAPLLTPDGVATLRDA